MFSRRVFIFIAALLLAGTAAAQQLTLDQILDRNIEALGGADAIKAVQTVTLNAKMVMGGGAMEAPLLTQAKRPGKVRAEVTIQGQKIISAFDGTDGWVINPMQGSTEPHKMSEAELKSTSQNGDIEANLGALKALRAAGQTVELVGKEDVDGKLAYRMKVTRKGGDVATYFLDAEKFLPVKQIMKAAQMGQEMEIEVFPSDYRKVGGVVMAFASESKVNGRTMAQMTIEKADVNLPMDDKLFKMPVSEKPAEKPAEKKQ
jgi:hypothetical protein